MMKRRGNSSRTPIGLHIDGRRVHAVQLSRSGSGWRIEAVACFRRSESDRAIGCEEVRHMRRTLGRCGFVGNDVVLAAPDEMLLTSILELPQPAGGVPVEQFARAELARMHKCDPESLEVSCHPLSTDAGASVLAASCLRSDVDALVDAFEAGGINIVAIDTHADAMAQACRGAIGGDFDPATILDVGWNSALLVVLRKGAVLYTQSLEHFGIRSLSHTLAERFDIDRETAECLLAEVRLDSDPDGDGKPFEDLRAVVSTHFKALAEKLKATLSYAAGECGGARVQRVLLVGDGVSVGGLDGLLAGELETDVSVVRAADFASCSPSLSGEPGWGAELATAVGLAQFAEADAPNRTNLIPAQRRRAKSARARKRRWLSVLGAYAVLLLLIFSACRIVHSQDRSAMIDEIARTRCRIKDAGRDLADARKALAEVSVKLAGNRAVGRQLDWGMFLAMLSESVGDDIVLNNFRLVPREAIGKSASRLTGVAALAAEEHAGEQRCFALEMNGYGRSRKAVSRFALHLEKLAVFDRVALPQTRQESVPGGKVVAFRLVCSLANGDRMVQK